MAEILSIADGDLAISSGTKRYDLSKEEFIFVEVHNPFGEWVLTLEQTIKLRDGLNKFLEENK